MKLKQPIKLEQTQNYKTPMELITEEFTALGLTPPYPIVADGQIHRFDIEKKGNKRGWYVLHDNGNFITGAIGDFQNGTQYSKVCTLNQEDIDPIKWAKIQINIQDKIRQVQIELQRQYDSVAESIEKELKETPQARVNNPYLVAKGISFMAHNLYEKDNALIVPLYNICYTKLKTAQIIKLQSDNSFKKQYVKGGQGKGAYFIFKNEDLLYNFCYLCEGVATGASIYRATQRPVVCAMSAGNLQRAVKELREYYPSIRIVAVADNDESGTGIKCANESGADSVILVPLLDGFKNMDANDYEQNGGDLRKLLQEDEEKKRSKIISDDVMIQNMASTEWWIKKWIPKQALVMVHGESGGGKTFVVRDMSLHIATGRDWCEQKVKKGVVLYLCGEGLQTVKERTLAWKLQNGIDSFANYSYTLPLTADFDKPRGLVDIVDQIESAEIKPQLIVIDTVNRYMEGDENSAQETRAFINNCSVLIERYKATVILVHHVGHAQSTKERARGSSAWRGALDTEISVHQSDGIITVKQTKQKGIEIQENKCFTLTSFSLPLKDEDGEQVKSAILVEQKEQEEQQSTDNTNYNVSLKLGKRNMNREQLQELVDGAYFLYGSELYDGSVSRKELIRYMIEQGYNETTARKWCDPKSPRHLNFSGIAKYMVQGRLLCFVLIKML